MPTTIVYASALAAVTLLAPAPASVPTGGPAALDSLPATDARVLRKLHAADQSEVKLGKYAQQHGGSPDVKSFGQRLEQDHAANAEKVEALAKKHDLTLMAPEPANADERQEQQDKKQTMDRLMSLDGADFDQQFAKAMVRDHRQDIEELEAAQSTLQTTEVKNLVANTLPTLREHLRIAESLSTSATRH